MNISTNRFPWKLLYLGIFVFIVLLVAYWYLFPRPNHALGPEVSFFGAAIATWWAFLTFKSGVVTSRFGPDRHRSTNPIAFWFQIAFLGALSVISLVLAFSWK
jgi:hypothetical protein